MEDWLTPLYDAEGMRAIDAWAIEQRGVPSLELMEAAGEAIAQAIEGLAGEGPIRVVCGKGNNGGDGLVAARRLAATGFEVEALLLWPAAELSPDAGANLRRFDGRVVERPADLAAALAGSGAIVDAIFGTGFEGAPRDPAAAAIEAINGAEAKVVAADIASGVDASTGEVEGVAVEAEVTVALHAAKLGHWIAPGKWASGAVRVVSIGVPNGAPGEPAAGLIGDAALAGLPRRDERSTKFSSGQVVVVGGSRGLTGAVCLAADGAARAGAGYVTVVVPAELELILEVKLTEAMSRGARCEDGAFTAAAADEAVEACAGAAAAVLGSGLGKTDGALELARVAAARIEAPLVLDADGLNAHAGRLEELGPRSAPTVLTPHAGELGRLLEIGSEEIEARRLASARDAARRAGAIVVLKGDDTIVTDGERVAVNGLASPALATAGSGDVLSGAIAALIARGAEPFTAACAAVRAHAAAGRLAAETIGLAEGVVAGDVAVALPAALGGAPGA
ncbi:MAG: ADP-dependent NAD(P)H-hydrate dehydratase / NAD(P)H-hydrate epimerase [Solirubrobacterales bacterium]|jgi:NAD(P)H-hydrate epimerase|nr:ADP-dependent NAD(P)H-hydrate dehydratase / NAD(P)H-hydrate epimerase [Solirubrobacterales bacterium]